MMPKNIFCLMGATATGKTDLAVELVNHFPFEIISVDSAMIYCGMDIGTAKPSAEILKIAPHRLINFLDPAIPYSAAQFCQDVIREIEIVFAKNKIPLLVGGTMLYFRALQQGLAELPSANESVREKIELQGNTMGWPALHQKLQHIDPLAASRIHPHDSQRIQRALEVFELTGESLSQQQKNNMIPTPSYQFYNFAPQVEDRQILHKRIEQRFENMLKIGLIAEVENLFKRDDLSLSCPAIRSVGYRQVWEYLLGNYSYQEMQEKGIVATRQLAKRQLTWLRSWHELQWFTTANDLISLIKKQLSC